MGNVIDVICITWIDIISNVQNVGKPYWRGKHEKSQKNNFLCSHWNACHRSRIPYCQCNDGELISPLVIKV